MAQIHVLDSATIDQIAAGEVIERPVSVVKELVENALDAGATAITVEIRGGGIELIRVTDNGCGIPADQVRVAFARHATSKIADAADLFSLSSLGFRGEALSSIASVARVELITRTADSAAGTRYVIEGGEEKAFEETAAREGTSFYVRDLFFNTPVRRKFLKTAQAEAGYVVTLMEQLCLSRPGISMELFVNGQEKLHTTSSYQMRDLIYTLYGREVTSLMRPLNYDERGILVQGYIGLPSLSRGTRAGILTFINGRFIKSPLVIKAVEAAYHGLTMQHKFPMAILHIAMEASLLDVNVHPTKMEVRFREEKTVFDVVYHAIRETLFSKDLIPRDAEEDAENEADAAQKAAAAQNEAAGEITAADAAGSPAKQAESGSGEKPERLPDQPGSRFRELIDAHKNTEADAAKAAETAGNPTNTAIEADGTIAAGAGREPFYSYTPRPAQFRETVDYRAEEDRRLLERFLRDDRKEAPLNGESTPAVSQPTEEISRAEAPAGAQQLELFEEKLLDPKKEGSFRLIGQVFGTYWLLEYEEWFLIADQHAVHEKVLFERTMKALADKTLTAQLLTPPLMLSLDGTQSATLERFGEAFAALGYEINHLGGREYAIAAVPGNLFSLPEGDFFIGMLDELAEERGAVPHTMLEEKVALMSCKAAIKANHSYSMEEAQALLKELLKLDNPYACPHGRPTMIRLSRKDMDKKFKRIV